MAVGKVVKRRPMAIFALVIAAAVLAIAAVPGTASASTPSNGPNGFCNTVIQQPTQFGISSIINITLIVLLAMISVIGLVAAIGYGFDIQTLKRFMRNEIGEIAITVIIAVVFIGTLSADGSLNTGYAATLSGISSNIFYQDCNALSITALYTSAPALVSIGSYQDVLNFIASITIQYSPNGFGIQTTPYQGIVAVMTPINNMFSIAGGMVGIMIAVPVILGIIYGLFPLFFYLGLVLRALPWTRAAGGAFLGIFLGLYIVFPLLLHAMLCTGSSICTEAPVTLTQPFAVNGFFNNYGPSGVTLSALYNIGSFFVNYIESAISTFSKGIINGTISSVISPVAFILFDVFISFIVSLDFAEIMGDYLGAQSLSGTSAFKKLI
ncbi:MAG: hypothetical protein M1500_00290 [Candidatus Marsarchaeota archaeon]|nr:hypothetical protein [Candidatus Marsarchaeota archaeon]